MYPIFFLLVRAVDKWRKHRRIITPLQLLAPNYWKNLSQYSTKIENRNLIKNMRKESNKLVTFDLFDYISRTAIDTICGQYDLI